MKDYSRIIFVGRSGTTREPMAKGIMEEYNLNTPVEILARGMVVLFPEPINQKADAVLVSNGIHMEKFASEMLSEDDITENTLILTMERAQKNKIIGMYKNINSENVHVITEFVGEELEILDPYGGSLQSYGLCYESLRKTIKKLVELLNDKE